MLVVAARDNFIVADEENRPGADFLAHAIFAPRGRPHDLANSRDFQANEPRGRVADNQQKLHPERSMPEQSKENLDDSEFRSRQRRAVGIVKVRVSDQFPAERAAGRNIAFNDIHAEHPIVSRKIVMFPVAAPRTVLVALGARRRCGLIAQSGYENNQTRYKGKSEAVGKKTGA
jgi:hypothetical protein